jgi:hypothetical protein
VCSSDLFLDLANARQVKTFDQAVLYEVNSKPATIEKVFGVQEKPSK